MAVNFLLTAVVFVSVLTRLAEHPTRAVQLFATNYLERFAAGRPERFAALRDLLGERFIAVELDSSPGNPHRIPRLAHAVLTHDLVDQPGHPTRAALDQVLSFLAARLLPSG